LLDQISAFEDFKSEVLPKIQKMLKDGKSSAEIRAFAQAYLTARQVTIALTSTDESAALRAIDAVTHQNEGKPRERVEHEHKLSKLKPEELDALLLSEAGAVLGDSDTTEH
jgi:hypothetical protein